MTLIGYARVSTHRQDTALQDQALQEAGVARIFTDTITGSTTARPQLTAMLDYVREGDTVVVWKLDRFGRSLRDLIDLVNSLAERGVGFRSLTEQIDTTTPTGRFHMHLFGALAEMERELIRERTLAGLAAARANGRTGGRPTVMTPEKITAATTLRRQGASLDDIAKALGVGRASVSRALSRHVDKDDPA